MGWSRRSAISLSGSPRGSVAEQSRWLRSRCSLPDNDFQMRTSCSARGMRFCQCLPANEVLSGALVRQGTCNHEHG